MTPYISLHGRPTVLPPPILTRGPQRVTNPSPWHPVWRVLAACASLAARGTRIRAAHLYPTPAIAIDPPPAGLFPTLAYQIGGRGGARYCTATWRGVRVTWTLPAGSRP